MTTRAARLTIIAFLTLLLASAGVAAPTTLSARYAGKVYNYTVAPTGENFTFEFQDNPGTVDDRLAIIGHVFDGVYDDSSIPQKHHYFFMKEGAKCFVFEANLYTYHACFLPNEYAPGKQDRFWGYVTRIPNGWWLVTRNLVPALLVLGVALYFLFRKDPRTD